MTWTRMAVGIACLASVLPLRAQQFAQVSGTITDPSGGAVEGAAVSVFNEDTGIRRTTQTQENGGYLVASLHPGLYKITIRKEGFRTVVRFGVRLSGSPGARVDFSLPLGSMQETVTVEGSPVLFNTENASVSTLLTREQIEHVPAVNNRGVLSLIEFAPGAVITPATRGEAGQFTVNGQRPNSHYFTADGVSVNTGVSGGGLPAQSTGGALPGVNAFGGLHHLISLDALDEMRVQTSSGLPEFGRLPGANVALTSRSGTSRLHGSFSHYFRNESLEANDWFANSTRSRTPLRFNDFSAAIGGPIHRDRTFFFASFESIRLRQPFVWQSPVPSLAARKSVPEALQPVLALFPEPNGPNLEDNTAQWTAHFDRPSRLYTGGLRLDHALTSRITLFARYNSAPSYSEFGSWQVNQLSLKFDSITAGLNARLTPNLIEDFRFNTTYVSADSLWRQSSGTLLPECFLTPLTKALTLNQTVCESFFRFSIAGIGQLVSGRESKTWQRQWNLVETLSFNRGAHQFRFGADYRRLRPERQSPAVSLSLLSEGMSDLLANRNLWLSISKTEYASSLLEEISAYAQDNWRVNDRLNLTFGARWEVNPPPTSSNPVFGLKSGSQLFGPLTETPLWPVRYTNIAPRFGLAYRPTKSGTVIRAGAGLFYDSSLSVATDLVNGGPLSVSQFANPASQGGALATLILSYGFLPGLRLPEVWQWNVAVERTFAARDAFSAGYVGSRGDMLLRREMGGPGTSEVLRLVMATNHGRSDYHALQLQYRRRVTRGLHGLISYAWSHSIDTDSADPSVNWIGSGLAAARDRGSSDFDVRHTFKGVFTYSLPGKANGWTLDGVVHARGGFPINVLDTEYNQGVSFANVYRPELLAGRPVWIDDASSPGGRRLNRAAFEPKPGTQGSLGRNTIRGFGMVQTDLSVRRDWRLGEKRSVLTGVEATNVLNHANFADPVRFLSSPLFGKSPSMLNLMLGTGSPASGLAPALQLGGPRAVQLVVRFRF